MSEGSARTAPRRTRWAALAALLVGAALAVALGGVATERWARQSRSFCVSCHADVRAHAAGHRDARCQSCHETTVTERLGMAVALWRGRRPAAPHASAQASTCGGCHAATEAFRASPGHAAHRAESARQLTCTNCHASSLHGRPSRRESCTGCHAQTPMRSEPRDEGACVRCHEFTRGAPNVTAAQRTGVTDTQAPRVDGTHLHGGVDCRQCHNPHREATDPNTPSGALCTRCHRGEIVAQVTAGPAGHQTCDGCHSVHASRDQRAVQCERCHTAPHRQSPAEALRAHADEQDPAAPRRPRAHGDVANAPAIRAWLTVTNRSTPSAGAAPMPATAPHNEAWTHAGRCATCHRPHTWTARSTDCRGCHTQQAGTLTPESPHGRNECTSCHDPHGPRPNGTVCASCHTEQGRQAAQGAPSGHAQCTGCHQPHAPARPTVAVCASCHQAQHDRVERGPAQHTLCTSCHTPHGASGAHTPATCASCHRVEASYFATAETPTAHQRCEACHAQHDFSRGAARGSCARCHSDLASHRGSHRGDCTSCHTPHAPVQGPDTHACASCHVAVHIGGPPAGQAAHQRCEGCHQPHRARLDATNACARCHTVQATTARTWPASSPHGGDCRQCHAPHLDRERPSCGSCHAAQSNANHYGRHAACTQCHDPHRDRPAGGGSAWWTRCADCHRAEGEAARASTTTATHQQCSNCHQRPGLRPPTCATCHANISTTLLHASQHHNNCVGCHGSHGNAPPGRAQCVTCHADRAATHFPDAPRCQSCHPFSPDGGRRP